MMEAKCSFCMLTPILTSFISIDQIHYIYCNLESGEWRMVVQLLMEGKFRRTTSIPIRNISNADLVWKGEDGTM